jgi:hypothetical protein
MNLEQLPMAPVVLPDESLSSWVERIALFYGGDYELGLGAVYARAERLPLQQEDDIDVDAQIRESVCAWTNSGDADVPALLDGTSLDTLPRRARLTYCPDCWDDDVAAGHPPYWRRRWARWCVVHCDRHGCWLTSRRPWAYMECLHIGWAPIWSTRVHWASTLELQVREAYERMMLGFDPKSIELRVNWRSLGADLVHFEHACDPSNAAREDLAIHRKLLQAVSLGPIASLRLKVAERYASHGGGAESVGFIRSNVPLWLGTRIMSLLIAVECLRIVKRRASVHRGMATMVRESGIL